MTIQLGVVVAREAIDHPWQSHIWRPYAVFLGAPDGGGWRELRRGPGYEHYYTGTLPLQLHRREVAGYTVNLSNGVPSLYVVLRENSDVAGPPVDVHLVTASPFDVQAYGATPEEIVGRVAMPEALVDLVAAFIETHHVDQTVIPRAPDDNRRSLDAAAVRVRDYARRAGGDPGQA